MAGVFCSIYKSSRKDEMYLYVLRTDALKRVPEPLMNMFGTPRHVTDMILSPERKLARADIAQVLEQLAGQGYYLQMPPAPESLLIQGDQAAWRRRSAFDTESESDT